MSRLRLILLKVVTRADLPWVLVTIDYPNQNSQCEYVDSDNSDWTKWHLDELLVLTYVEKESRKKDGARHAKSDSKHGVKSRSNVYEIGVFGQRLQITLEKDYLVRAFLG